MFVHNRKCVLVGYQVRMKAYHLWDPKARKMVISWDVIFFNEWPKPPGQPEEPVDLSKIIWNGELEYKNIENISRVGDSWHLDNSDVKSADCAPSYGTPTTTPDKPEIPLPNPPSLQAQPAQIPHWWRCTELEMLGELPIIDGPWERWYA